MSRGACMAGGVHCKGAVVWQGACMVGGLSGMGHAWQEGGMHGRRDGFSSGRYASYWNVFLLAPSGKFWIHHCTHTATSAELVDGEPKEVITIAIYLGNSRSNYASSSASTMDRW